MSVCKIESESINEFKATYELDDMQVIETNNIICIFVKTNNCNLENNWKKINSILSELINEYLDSSFKKWNVYIIYVVTDLVSKELKYKIENNTFFARKIVEDNYSSELTDEEIKKIISEHIIFNDLQINLTQPAQEEYSSESEIYQKFKDIDTINQTQIDEMLKSLEGAESEI
jgi:hypothetical protein